MVFSSGWHDQSGFIATDELLGNVTELDLVRAFADEHQRGITAMAFDVILGGVPITVMNTDRVEGNLGDHLGSVELRIPASVSTRSPESVVRAAWMTSPRATLPSSPACCLLPGRRPPYPSSSTLRCQPQCLPSTRIRQRSSRPLPDSPTSSELRTPCTKPPRRNPIVISERRDEARGTGEPDGPSHLVEGNTASDEFERLCQPGSR